jgi:hypothetical protein
MLSAPSAVFLICFSDAFRYRFAGSAGIGVYPTQYTLSTPIPSADRKSDPTL